MSRKKMLNDLCPRAFQVLSLAIALLSSGGCASQPDNLETKRFEPSDRLFSETLIDDFGEHRRRASEHLSEYRVPVDGFPPREQMRWVLPFQKPPSPGCGPSPHPTLLLIHGLNDTPHTFRTLAQAMSERCMKVRAILLSGHGTRPGDMIRADAEQWIAEVQAHVADLAQADGPLFIGGHSLGAGLATIVAAENSAVDGLVAFAPVWELPGRLGRYLWLAPTASLFLDYVDSEYEPERNPLKYENITINSGAQIDAVREQSQELLEKGLDKPVFLVASEADSVISLEYLQRTYRSRLNHPGNRFIFYRDQRRPLPDWWRDENMHAFGMHLPEQNILEMSHQAMAISPRDSLYGLDGPLRHCLEPNGVSLKTCRSAQKVMYTAYGYPSSRAFVTSRLTYNPHFPALVERLDDFLNRHTRSSDLASTRKNTRSHTGAD